MRFYSTTFRLDRRAVTFIGVGLVAVVTALCAGELLALASYNVSFMQGNEEVPQEKLLASTCSLAVIVAELPPKFGKLIKELVHMGLTDTGFIMSDYKDFEETIQVCLCALLLGCLLSVGNSRICIVQASHWYNHSVVFFMPVAYDHSLLSLCSRSVVITVHDRCLERSVQWSHLSLNNTSTSYFLGLVYVHFLWRRVAVLDLTHESLARNPLHCAALLGHIINQALNISYKGEISELSHGAHRELDRARIIEGASRNKSVPFIRDIVQGVYTHLRYDSRMTALWTLFC